MSCDGEHAKEVFIRATTEAGKAIILYTEEGNCCVFESNSWQPLGPHQPTIFTITNMKTVDTLDISAYESASSGVDVVVEYRAHLDENVDPDLYQSIPTSHVAAKNPTKIMVYILVSAIATGFVIIMLFLGLRAHKRMEGDPTQNLGPRPRQSRARGIARAALDAIPIIKFKTRSLEKDLEMQDGDSSLGSTTGLSLDGGTPTLEAPQSDVASADPATINTPPSHPLPHSIPSNLNEVPIPNSPNPSQTRCPVCFDDFEEDQAVRVLPCNHSFHVDCIDPWLLNVAGSCPLCRTDLSSPEECEQDPPTNILTPLPTVLISRPSNSSGLSERLQEMVEVAQSSSALEERLAAARAVRDEGGNGNRWWGHARSKKPEWSILRLGRAMLGSGGGENSRNSESRTSTLQAETDRVGLAEAGNASGLGPSPPLSRDQGGLYRGQ